MLEHAIIFNLLVGGVDALTSDFAFGALLAIEAAVQITSALVFGVRGRPPVAVDQELATRSREADPLALTLPLVHSVLLSDREAREKADEGLHDDIRHRSSGSLVYAPTPTAVALEGVVVPVSMAVHRNVIPGPEVQSHDG